jgi:curved DNA-binding protein CbpA
MDIQACLLLLELETPLTPVGVHRAYRRMVKRWHPDQFAHQPEIHAIAEERLKKINQAYTIVNDYLEDQPPANFNANDFREPLRQNSPPTFSPRYRTVSSRPKQPAKKQTANAQRGARTPAGFASAGGHQRSNSRKPSSNFERILRDIGKTDIPSGNHHRAGARAMSRLHPGRRRSKRLHVEGFTPIIPLQPVRPVSKIGPIEGSD